VANAGYTYDTLAADERRSFRATPDRRSLRNFGVHVQHLARARPLVATTGRWGVELEKTFAPQAVDGGRWVC
jgi:hypothetical protein